MAPLWGFKVQVLASRPAPSFSSLFPSACTSAMPPPSMTYILMQAGATVRTAGLLVPAGGKKKKSRQEEGAWMPPNNLNASRNCRNLLKVQLQLQWL